MTQYVDKGWDWNLSSNEKRITATKTGEELSVSATLDAK